MQKEIDKNKSITDLFMEAALVYEEAMVNPTFTDEQTETIEGFVKIGSVMMGDDDDNIPNIKKLEVRKLSKLKPITLLTILLAGMGKMIELDREMKKQIKAQEEYEKWKPLFEGDF